MLSLRTTTGSHVNCVLLRGVCVCARVRACMRVCVCVCVCVCACVCVSWSSTLFIIYADAKLWRPLLWCPFKRTAVAKELNRWLEQGQGQMAVTAMCVHFHLTFTMARVRLKWIFCRLCCYNYNSIWSPSYACIVFIIFLSQFRSPPFFSHLSTHSFRGFHLVISYPSAASSFIPAASSSSFSIPYIVSPPLS